MGTLYIVATPIGNLGDITYRAVETLQQVDVIVAEDTRVSRKLLERYNIDKPLRSLRERSPRAEFERIAKRIENGESVAYITDAGTPGISDPGNLLVSLTRERCGEKAVVPIPGPSALTAALSVAGFSVDEFVYLGFLPHKKGRQKLLDELALMKRSVVLFESPHRIVKLFEELEKRIPGKNAVIFRELTKTFEQVVAGTVQELHQRLLSKDIPVLGEFVVAISR